MDFVEIDKEKFRKLYEETDLSNKEIALKLGSIFQKDGFEIVDITNADYEYVYDLKSVSRITYKKNPLKYKDYNKVYDCGKIKLKLAL